jgi:hypothetical protein
MAIQDTTPSAGPTTTTTPRADVSYQVERRLDANGIFMGGLVAGVIAGAVMALVWMIKAGIEGAGFFLPARAIAGTYYGAEALAAGGGWAITLGVLTHVVVSAFWGLLFAWVGGARMSTGAACFAGLLYGIAIWALMSYAVLPAINPAMLGRVSDEPGWWFGYHLIFGGMLLLTPGLARAFSTRRRIERVPAATP